MNRLECKASERTLLHLKRALRIVEDKEATPEQLNTARAELEECEKWLLALIDTY